MLAEVILASNLTELHTTVAKLTCLEAILERAEEDVEAADDDQVRRLSSLEAVSQAIKSPAFLQHRHARRISKRNIMEDIVASYSNVFGSKSRPGKKKQPVVFLPNSNDGKKCEPSGAMSSFGYLSFVLSLINAAVNAANNVNNNQNNNNNNDNNNNDNNNNVNVANSNINQNNDNAVTAGRRRRKLKFEDREDIRRMLQAHLVNTTNNNITKERVLPEVSYDENTSLSTPSILDPAIKVMTNAWTSLKSPIKTLLRLEKREAAVTEKSIKEQTIASTNSEKVVVSKKLPQAMENELEVVNQSLLAAFMFMDFWPRLELLQRPLNSKLVEQNLCSLQRALNQIGPWAKLIARPLALGMMTLHPQIANLHSLLQTASAEKPDGSGYGSRSIAVAFALKRLSRGENIC